MRKRMVTMTATTLALGLFGAAPAFAADNTTPAGSATAPAAAHGMPGMPAHAGAPTSAAPQAPEAPPAQQDVDQAIQRAKSKPVFFAAKLAGVNEVPVAGGPAVGDQDGSGTGLVRIQGNRVTFSLAWKGINAPTLGHIHQGIVRENGPVKVPLFATPMPDTVDAAAGGVTITDPAIADQIRINPFGFYVNLHTKDFPGGAVRGQLQPVDKASDVLRLLKGGRLRAFMSGDQEVPVPNGPAVGNPEGRAIGFASPKGNKVWFSFAWIGLAPTLGHIHKGAFGANGPVAVPLFATPIPDTVFAVAGSAPADPSVVSQLNANPSGFYLNLHSAKFPGGDVRGQLIA